METHPITYHYRTKGTKLIKRYIRTEKVLSEQNPTQATCREHLTTTAQHHYVQPASFKTHYTRRILWEKKRTQEYRNHPHSVRQLILHLVRTCYCSFLYISWWSTTGSFSSLLNIPVNSAMPELRQSFVSFFEARKSHERNRALGGRQRRRMVAAQHLMLRRIYDGSFFLFVFLFPEGRTQSRGRKKTTHTHTKRNRQESKSDITDNIKKKISDYFLAKTPKYQ